MKEELNKKIVWSIIVAMSLANASPTFAEQAQENAEQVEQSAADPNVHRLDTVNITAEEEKDATISLTREEIELMPNATGTITDLFRGNSNVQFDKNSRSANTAGEITPPKISINGAKFYENNYTINGVGNNSQLNPNGFEANPDWGNVAPSGDSQAIFLDPSLIQELNVYTENVSAQYGDFIGGVIDVKLIDGSMDKYSGSIGYRYTEDSLVYFRVTPGENDDLAGKDFQPYFKKGNLSAYLNGYIVKDKLGFLASYTNSHSFITKRLNTHGGEKTVDEERMNENYMLRLNTNPDGKYYFALTANYAPYQSTHLNPDYKDGGAYDIEGGGLSLILNNHVNFDFAKWTNDIGYISSEVSRNADDNAQYVYPAGSADWATSSSNFSGGFGYYHNEQNTLSWKSMLDFEALTIAGMEHNFIAGFEIKYHDLMSDMEGVTIYNLATVGSAPAGYAPDGIYDGIYAGMKTVIEGGKQTTNYSTYAFFLEDTIEWERVTLRPGVRITYDNIMENLDIAPRLFVNVDVLNDDRFNIYGGYNRYYGSQILSQAIAPEYTTLTSMRNAFMPDWFALGTPYTTVGGELSDLKNPYTDEFVLGATANIYGFMFKIDGVYRNNEDLLRSEQIDTDDDGNIDYLSYSNEGESEYMGLTLSISKSWDWGNYGLHHGELSATISKVEGNSLDWDNVSSGTDPTLIWDPSFISLQGVITPKSGFNPGNYNSPLTIAYTHSASYWEDRLRLYATLRWEAESDQLLQDSDYDIVLPNGKTAQGYVEETIESHFNMDLSVAWDVWKYKNQTFTLEADVYNLFNKTYSPSASSSDEYTMGRQFYFGIRYTF